MLYLVKFKLHNQKLFRFYKFTLFYLPFFHSSLPSLKTLKSTHTHMHRRTPHVHFILGRVVFRGRSIWKHLILFGEIPAKLPHLLEQASEPQITIWHTHTHTYPHTQHWHTSGHLEVHIWKRAQIFKCRQSYKHAKC